MSDSFKLDIRGTGVPIKVLIDNLVAVIAAQPGLEVTSVEFKFGSPSNFESEEVLIPDRSLAADIMCSILSGVQSAVVVPEPGSEESEPFIQTDLEEQIALEEAELAAAAQLPSNPSEEEKSERKVTVITPDPVEVKLIEG